MKYVKGARLGKEESIKLFYSLSYNMLIEYLNILTSDSKTLANYGIQAFDCRENNIILSSTGFRQIDCIDFKIVDVDPNITTKINIELMCITIWESLITKHLSTFLINNNLKLNQFTESPIEFIQELKRISQEYSDTEIITIEDTKKLSRKK